MRYFVQQIFDRITPNQFYFLSDLFHYFRRLCKYNASIKTNKDLLKMKYTLSRENHVIEKGLSFKNTKKGFGQAKIKDLLVRLNKYADLYMDIDRDFLLYPLCTIKSYIQYTKDSGVCISEIESSLEALVDKVGYSQSDLIENAGVKEVNKSNIIDSCRKDFSFLLNNRHSIRYFTDKIPSKDTIDKILTLAQRTPSACNRQAWHTHVFSGDDCHHLLKMQGGCRGFEDDIHCAIVVTTELRGFLAYEPFQCYIDGGLYSMNLINAIHFCGLGCTPLSCGFHFDKLEGIKKYFKIPVQEELIMIIGMGELEDQFKVAISKRRSINKTNTYHYE